MSNNGIILDKKAFEAHLECLKCRMKESESEELSNRIQTLIHKSLNGGIISDDLTGTKYYVESNKCLGGGPIHSKARDVEDHDPTMLCHKNEETVMKELDLLKNNRFRTEAGNRTSRIMIRNYSRYPLVYKAQGDTSGFFFSDACDAFKETYIFNNKSYNDCLPPNYYGGVFHTKQSDTACGSVGYISFTVPTEGKDYVVVIGFCNPYSGRSSVGVQIRGADGVTDKSGNITCHGINPTGSVLDLEALISMHPHTTMNNSFHKCEESCSKFKVIAQFENISWSRFYFDICNV